MEYGPRFWEGKVHYPIEGGPLKHTTLPVFPLLPIFMKSSWPGLSFTITVSWGQLQETSQQQVGWSWKIIKHMDSTSIMACFHNPIVPEQQEIAWP